MKEEQTRLQNHFRQVEAVLLANTYHEMAHPKPILASILRALIPGGRLVVIDRGPGSAEHAADSHAVPLPVVTEALRRQGFYPVESKDPFIPDRGDGSWWLIVARKPS